MESSTTARKKRTTTIRMRGGNGSMDPMVGKGSGDGDPFLPTFSDVQRNRVPDVPLLPIFPIIVFD
eukprot:6095249-Prorocentrum_lima.AAC.1